jgi:hypothetical protein
MNADSSVVLGAVLGALIALATSVVVEILRYRFTTTQQERSWEKERKARQQERDADRQDRRKERQDDRQDRHEDFQRQTLIALQDELVALLRAASAAHDERNRLAREATEEQRAGAPIPKSGHLIESEGEYRVAFFRVMVLGVRLDGQPLKDDLNRLLNLGNELVFSSMALPPDPTRKNPAWEMVDLQEKVNKRIGLLLRGEVTVGDLGASVPSGSPGLTTTKGEPQ